MRKGHTKEPWRWERREGEAESDSMRTQGVHSVVRPTHLSITKLHTKRNHYSGKLLDVTGRGVLFLTFLVAGRSGSSERSPPRKRKRMHLAAPFKFAGGFGSCFRGRSTALKRGSSGGTSGRWNSSAIAMGLDRRV